MRTHAFNYTYMQIGGALWYGMTMKRKSIAKTCELRINGCDFFYVKLNVYVKFSWSYPLRNESGLWKGCKGAKSRDKKHRRVHWGRAKTSRNLLSLLSTNWGNVLISRGTYVYIKRNENIQSCEGGASTKIKLQTAADGRKVFNNDVINDVRLQTTFVFSQRTPKSRRSPKSLITTPFGPNPAPDMKFTIHTRRHLSSQHANCKHFIHNQSTTNYLRANRVSCRGLKKFPQFSRKNKAIRQRMSTSRLTKIDGQS
jgi:hypothetical protein